MKLRVKVKKKKKRKKELYDELFIQQLFLGHPDPS
jgi:hypothetical protein